MIDIGTKVYFNYLDDVYEGVINKYIIEKDRSYYEITECKEYKTGKDIDLWYQRASVYEDNVFLSYKAAKIDNITKQIEDKIESIKQHKEAIAKVEYAIKDLRQQLEEL